MRALLRRTSGIEGLLEEIDFSGLLAGQALDEIFPRTATIAHDGYGNFWAVDLLRVKRRSGGLSGFCRTTRRSRSCSATGWRRFSTR